MATGYHNHHSSFIRSLVYIAATKHRQAAPVAGSYNLEYKEMTVEWIYQREPASSAMVSINPCASAMVSECCQVNWLGC